MLVTTQIYRDSRDDYGTPCERITRTHRGVPTADERETHSVQRTEEHGAVYYRLRPQEVER